MLVLLYLVWLFMLEPVLSKKIDSDYIHRASHIDKKIKAVVINLKTDDHLFLNDALYDCPKFKESNFKFRKMLITGGHFTELPGDLFSGFVYLNALIFDGGKLRSIPKTLLRGIRKLTTFMIVNHNLESIVDELFQDTHQMKILSFKNNKIEYLPNSDIFENLPNLLYLSLANNRITTIEPTVKGVFSKYSKLIRINLDGNYLSDWPNQNDQTGNPIVLSNLSAIQSSTFTSDALYPVSGICRKDLMLSFSISENKDSPYWSIRLMGKSNEIVNWANILTDNLVADVKLEVLMLEQIDDLPGTDSDISSLNYLCNRVKSRKGMQNIFIVCRKNFPGNSLAVIRVKSKTSLRLCIVEFGALQNVLPGRKESSFINLNLSNKNARQNTGPNPSVLAYSCKCAGENGFAETNAFPPSWVLELFDTYEIAGVRVGNLNDFDLTVKISNDSSINSYDNYVYCESIRRKRDKSYLFYSQCENVMGIFILIQPVVPGKNMKICAFEAYVSFIKSQNGIVPIDPENMIQLSAGSVDWHLSVLGDYCEFSYATFIPYNWKVILDHVYKIISIDIHKSSSVNIGFSVVDQKKKEQPPHVCASPEELTGSVSISCNKAKGDVVQAFALNSRICKFKIIVKESIVSILSSKVKPIMGDRNHGPELALSDCSKYVFSQTYSSKYPYWLIDLEDSYDVESVTVHNGGGSAIKVRVAKNIIPNSAMYAAATKDVQDCGENIEPYGDFPSRRNCNNLNGRYVIIIVQDQPNFPVNIRLCGVKISVFNNGIRVAVETKTKKLRRIDEKYDKKDDCQIITKQHHPHFVADLHSVHQILNVRAKIKKATYNAHQIFVFISFFKPNLYTIGEEHLCATYIITRQKWDVDFNCFGRGRFIMIITDVEASLVLCNLTVETADYINSKVNFTTTQMHSPKIFDADLPLTPGASCNTSSLTFAFTKTERNPIWTLMVGVRTKISSVHVLPVNQDRDQSMEWKLVISVNDNKTKNICFTYRGRVRTGSRLPFACSSVLEGSNVTITRRGAYVAFGVCGIEVYKPIENPYCSAPSPIANGYFYPKNLIILKMKRFDFIATKITLLLIRRTIG